MTKKPNFLRRVWNRHSKLGKKRKKKQVWRRPTGRDNKMREKRKGYPAVVSIGYKSNKKSRGEIENKKPIVINNVNELDKLKEDSLIILGKVGMKKKIEILKKINEKKLQLYKINPEKAIKKALKKVKK